MSAECLACKAGKDVHEYCRENPTTDDCDTHGGQHFMATSSKDDGDVHEDGAEAEKPSSSFIDEGKSSDDASWVMERLDKKPVEEVGEAICCGAMTAKCLACKAGKSVKEYCKENAETDGCKAFGGKRARWAPGGSWIKSRRHKFKEGREKRRGDKPVMCCQALTAKCLACKAGKGVQEYCKESPDTKGCDSDGDKKSRWTRGSWLKHRKDKFEEYRKKRRGDDSGSKEASGESEKCCRAMSAACLACQEGKDVQEYCKEKPDSPGC
eukprot:TRINITY_DN2631_c0_g1_i4.p1 TRINITY_DN2631_c0_g1~~TRINITY_DN2631_c0_g1_i4.p1  ORF type:complete len:267 (-),score=47.67 TRINITY_DN2631_c0_g1_i4:363-1163(-)